MDRSLKKSALSPEGADGGGETRATIQDALAALEQIAPFALAAEWDNVGLLAGREDWPVRHALMALDLTDDVAREALDGRAELLILYHPPIFKSVRRVTPAAEGPTSLLPDLLAARVSLVALHTALDAAVGGTNDIVLDAFEISARWPLEPLTPAMSRYKLVVFVPPEHVPRLRGALSDAGAGEIGRYRECSFESAGHGTFRGDEDTHPAIGQPGEFERVDECRLEMVVPRRRLGEVVRALYANHIYEEPAFDVFPLQDIAGRAQAGMGRVGRLAQPCAGSDLVEALAAKLNLKGARCAGALDRTFTTVTAAAGSFGTRSFTDPQSLYITGEFKHHDALELARRGVTCLMLGHYESERPALERVRDRFAELCPAVRCRIARADRSPLPLVT